MNLKTKMRTGDVTRYHMVRTLRQQTIAEHMYRVWLIAMRLFDELREYKKDDGTHVFKESMETCHKIRWDITNLALSHDLNEVLTGDVPSQTKEAVRILTYSDPWKSLDQAIGVPAVYGHDIVQTIVELADKMESWYFIKTEGSGDFAKSVEAKVHHEVFVVAHYALATSVYNNFPWWNVASDLMTELDQGNVQMLGDMRSRQQAQKSERAGSG